MKFSFVAASLVPWLRLIAALNFSPNQIVLKSFTENSYQSNEYFAPLMFPGYDADVAQDSYIVVFNDGFESHELENHLEWLHQAMYATEFEKIEHVYDISENFRGYSGKFSKSSLDAIRSDTRVKFVEPDVIVHTAETVVQNNAPWGLARVSHREKLNATTSDVYTYDSTGGEGVNAYIIDTGIYIDHVDFGNRATWGAEFGTSVGTDDNGHGTHCAGVTGGTTFGVAKNVSLIAVKVLNGEGSGSTSDIIQGIEWVVSDHQTKSTVPGFKGSVANMSLGGSKISSLDNAVNAAVEAGISFAVAAGNSNANACYTSPAASDKAITVGAISVTDARPSFSNYGKCVDIFAPGVDVESDYIGSSNATTTMSGTSMATPHVAGLLAYFLSLQPTNTSGFSINSATPDEFKTRFLRFGTHRLLKNIGSNSPNLLAFSGAGKTKCFWQFTNTTGCNAGSSTKLMELEALESRIQDELAEIKKDMEDLTTSFFDEE